MILYRKEPYPLQMKNIMLLDDNATDGVVYVSKATYDQALMLFDRFDGNIKRVTDALMCKKLEKYIAIVGLINLVSEMGRTMPEPINILAPFLILATNNEGIEWEKVDREMAYGLLHQYSQLIDFNAMTLVPAEVRANVTIPTAILKQYKVSWDDLCSTLKDKVVYAPAGVLAPTQQVSTTVSQQTSNVAPTSALTPTQEPPKVEEKKEESDDEEELTPIQKKLLELKKNADAKAAEINKKAASIKKPESKPVVKEPAPVAPKIEEKEAKEANDVLDEFDI